MGLALTLQGIGADFNASTPESQLGLCGNFNGLRDDDVSVLALMQFPIDEDLVSMATFPMPNRCLYANEIRFEHMISSQEANIEMLEEASRDYRYFANTETKPDG